MVSLAYRFRDYSYINATNPLHVLKEKTNIMLVPGIGRKINLPLLSTFLHIGIFVALIVVQIKISKNNCRSLCRVINILCGHFISILCDANLLLWKIFT